RSRRMMEALRTAHLWVPGWCVSGMRNYGLAPPKRIWLMIADHFEPWWRDPHDQVAFERVARWTDLWPEIAHRQRDSIGRPACHTFFYPAEQYHPRVLDSLAELCQQRVSDVEVHLHHSGDTAEQFRERMAQFVETLHRQHGLLHRENGR